MGKPNIRLNPQIDSIRNRVLLQKGTEILLSIALLLPPPTLKKGRGRRPYDYRIVLVLCILRILLRKKYADYEAEMRFDKRLMEMLSISKLPCKSTINNYALLFTLGFLSNFNKELIGAWIKKPVDLLLDASGIRLVGRSIWFCIRTKTKILKFLKKLLRPFRFLGLVIADKGYSGKKNAEFVAKKEGAFFSPFKSNIDGKGLSLWSNLFRLWSLFPSLCEGIYNQRSKIEAVFSALKRRYGDQLYSKKWFMRRREMAMRFIAYNLRIIIGIQIAREKNIPLWVRA